MSQWARDKNATKDVNANKHALWNQVRNQNWVAKTLLAKLNSVIKVFKDFYWIPKDLLFWLATSILVKSYFYN